MISAELLAKSRRSDEPSQPSMRLLGHLSDAYQAALQVLDATADDQLLAMGLDPTRYGARFRRSVVLAALVHDLGKANDHFQAMIKGTRNVTQNPQGLRHEWVSVLLLEGLRSWLLPAVDDNEVDFASAVWAVAGHHPSPAHASPPSASPSGSGPEITFLTSCPDFAAILEFIRQTLDLSDVPSVRSGAMPLVGTQSLFTLLMKWERTARRFCDQQLKNGLDRRFVAAIKASLIAADVAGSALPRVKPHDPARWNWIAQSFESRPTPADLESIAGYRLKDCAPRPFQLQVAESKSPVTYVKAGCGTGKTVAAYLWAARSHPNRRLYFCYPTTGTATEGFKDYLFEPDGELGSLGARLFHSRRDVDFEIILNTGADRAIPDADDATRIESLEAWSTPIVACTVDTVLGLIQNHRRGLYAWPALAQSAFVFDEIHAYDDRLFASLLRFLRDLPGLPALLMTASLPQSRECALRDVLSKHRGIALESIPGPSDLEDLPRYHKIDSATDPFKLAQSELAAGGKVLWVCNTVKRVMETSFHAESMGLHPLLYHSRFKYIDRVARHKQVVTAFTPSNSDPTLAVCSQVAEMSLDLKGCTLLISDLAPVPALIQRLGRLNRQARAADPTRPFAIVEPESPLPYTSQDLDAARCWLASLQQSQMSQRYLAEQWEQEDVPSSLPGESAWLDGGPKTEVKELRDGTPGISVLMAEDLPQITKPRDVARFTLPMPQPRRELNWQAWRRFHGIPVAVPGSVSYDPIRGATWAR